MRENNKHKSANIGTSLILVVFIILTLVTFAALSAVASAADYNASQLTLKRTEDYYKASSAGEEKLLEIEHVLKPFNQSDKKAYPKECLESLENIDVSIISWQEGNYRVSFTIPIDDTQLLYCELTLSPGSDSLFTREVWEKRSVKPWQGDTAVTLLQ